MLFLVYQIPPPVNNLKIFEIKDLNPPISHQSALLGNSNPSGPSDGWGQQPNQIHTFTGNEVQLKQAGAELG